MKVVRILFSSNTVYYGRISKPDMTCTLKCFSSKMNISFVKSIIFTNLYIEVFGDFAYNYLNKSRIYNFSYSENDCDLPILTQLFSGEVMSNMKICSIDTTTTKYLKYK